MQLDGQLIVVSGAASGIGRALCSLLAQRRARIGLIDCDKSKLGFLADELRHNGVQCCAQVVDVRQREKVVEAIRTISEQLGPVDVVVASAGVCRASTIDDLSGQDVEKVVLTNLLGTIHIIEAVVPTMLQRGRGHIIGISSLAGIRGIPYEAAYSASKAGVAAYLESIRAELRPRAISVTTVFPGYVLTPLLQEVNCSAGADISNGKACTAAAAAVRIVNAIEKRKAHVHFPWMLGLGVHLSQVLPPIIYDWLMRRTFSHLPISREPSSLPEPANPRGVSL